jgi:hypothetical protein
MLLSQTVAIKENALPNDTSQEDSLLDCESGAIGHVIR